MTKLTGSKKPSGFDPRLIEIVKKKQLRVENKDHKKSTERAAGSTTLHAGDKMN